MHSVLACARHACLLTAVIMLVVLTGCHGVQPLPPFDLPALATGDPAARAAPPAVAGPAIPNPMSVPVRDREFFWNQLVDTIDDYFEIRTEQRVHMVGQVATEGRIESNPLPGATVFEPWRWDSTPGYEKWHSTLQSLRRKCLVQVQPQGANYVVTVVVEKALEDVNHPAQGTPGSAMPRHDRSLMRIKDLEDRGNQTLGWIPIGRDVSLEQEILRELTARLFEPGS